MGVMSGLEMACWDIIGKACDKPVHALIGGKLHETLRSYTYLYPDEDMDEDRFIMTLMRLLKWPPAMLMKGLTALKFDPAGAYTTLDPHMPELEAIDSSRKIPQGLREAVGMMPICSSVPMVSFPSGPKRWRG